MYKKLDIKNWARYEQYKFFKSYDYPFFNICSELDVTELVECCKTYDKSFFISILYASIDAANKQKEFKLRIKDDSVIEYESIYAGSTVLNDDETFNFCYFDYFTKFNEFNSNAKKVIKQNKDGTLEFDGKNNDFDMIHYSVIPWVSFTSFSHPRNFSNSDSIPKIVFGKYYKKDNKLFMPISIEVHHALMDGLHLGKYLEKLQKIIINTNFITN